MHKESVIFVYLQLLMRTRDVTLFDIDSTKNIQYFVLYVISPIVVQSTFDKESILGHS